MTGISSSVGLISGIDYTSIIDQMMAIQRIPIDNLQNRTTQLEKVESAISNLSAKFLTSSYMIENINKADIWRRCDVASSNTALLTATRSGSPTAGVYTFTPLRMAMSQQTFAQGVVSDTQALGKEGTITIGKGWSLEKDIELREINGGTGYTKGYIRITDGSGTRATIDLRSCTTLNDVLDKINNTHTIDVWAEMDGDKIKLVDMSGGDPDKFLVQDVSGGKTASSLGLTGAGVVNENGEITGTSLYRLSENMTLSSLNDGNGVAFDTYLSELQFTCKDGTRIMVDFNVRTNTTDEEDSHVQYELTIGDVINTINNANGNTGKIVASIGGPDGKSLVFTDTTKKYLIAERDDDNNYVLPDGYDEADGYTIDQDGGYVLDDQGEKVELESETVLTQPSNGLVNPALRTLGFIDGKFNMNEPLKSSDGVFTSRQLIGDLDSPLVASLNGGFGLDRAISQAKQIEALDGGNLKSAVEVQDRAGNRAFLEFSAAELKEMQSGSLNRTLKMLNEKLATAERIDADGNPTGETGIGLEFQLNQKKTGLELVDTTGSASANIMFKDVTITHVGQDEEGEEVQTVLASDIAKTLGVHFEGSATGSSLEGGSLHLQTVNHSTNLSELNGGKGITVSGGRMDITDSEGNSTTVFFDSAKQKTVGEIIDQINSARSSGVKILARINDTGDGIVIEDQAGGTGKLHCIDANNSSKIVAGLKLDQGVTTDPVTGRQIIDGAQTYSITVEKTDSLDDIRKKINELGGNFSASVIVDGTGAPYRLAISGGTTGKAGAMNIDLSCLGLTTENMTEAQDAMLVYGDAASNSGVAMYSSTNTFKNVVNGIDLTIAGTSDTPVMVTSELTSADVKASINAFVENYNSFREQLNSDTYYDTTLNMGNALYGNTLATAYDRDITKILQKQVYGIPGINSLQSIGLSVRQNIDDPGKNLQTGKLVFDETKFDELWNKDREGLIEFFFKEQEIVDPEGGVDEDGNVKMKTIKTGWAQQFMDVAESLTGNSSGSIRGKLGHELDTLDRKITQNYERISFMEERLLAKKEQMQNKFYAMEQAMAKMSADMQSVSSIASSWSSNYSTSGSYY